MARDRLSATWKQATPGARSSSPCSPAAGGQTAHAAGMRSASAFPPVPSAAGLDLSPWPPDRRTLIVRHRPARTTERDRCLTMPRAGSPTARYLLMTKVAAARRHGTVISGSRSASFCRLRSGFTDGRAAAGRECRPVVPDRPGRSACSIGAVLELGAGARADDAGAHRHDGAPGPSRGSGGPVTGPVRGVLCRAALVGQPAYADRLAALTIC